MAGRERLMALGLIYSACGSVMVCWRIPAWNGNFPGDHKKMYPAFIVQIYCTVWLFLCVRIIPARPMSRHTLIIHTGGPHPGQKRTEGYARLMRHPKWRAFRRRILDRDGHKCVHCLSTGHLQVHHRQYRLDYRTGHLVPPWAYEAACMITLCRDCHQAGHRSYRIPCFTTNMP